MAFEKNEEMIAGFPLHYHINQWDTPKESTKAFANFIKDNLNQSKTILDLGAGTGASTAYLANKATKVSFVAADYAKRCIEIGEDILKKNTIKNLSFELMDWYNLKTTNKYDGVISLQTLSWLPNAKDPLENIFLKLKPKWIAMNALFYEGDISCKIEVNQHSVNNVLPYNIYSLKEIERICEPHGYVLKKSKKFEIDIDIQKSSEINRMSTYTRDVRNKSGKLEEKLQISGPLLMPWYMILIEKK